MKRSKSDKLQNFFKSFSSILEFFSTIVVVHPTQIWETYNFETTRFVPFDCSWSSIYSPSVWISCFLASSFPPAGAYREQAAWQTLWATSVSINTIVAIKIGLVRNLEFGIYLRWANMHFERVSVPSRPSAINNLVMMKTCTKLRDLKCVK